VRDLLQEWRASLESLEQRVEPVAAATLTGVDRVGVRQQAAEIERKLQQIYDESFATAGVTKAERTVLYPTVRDALAHLLGGTRAWPDGLLVLGIRNARAQVEIALRQMLGDG
jgi:hypothetical protein